MRKWAFIHYCGYSRTGGLQRQRYILSIVYIVEMLKYFTEFLIKGQCHMFVNGAVEPSLKEV